jgi:RNA recognition motif-containing protein
MSGTETGGPSSMDKWLEFLATPPSFEKVTRHSDSESILPGMTCLPRSLFDDPPPASCPPFPQSSQSFIHLQPSTFIPEPFSEPESRLIQIANIDPGTTCSDIQSIFSMDGDIDAVDVSQVDQGVASVRFYHLQSAMQARQRRITHRGKCWVLGFGPPDPVVNPRKPPNNGTIVVFHLRQGVSDDEIRDLFSQFGEIRQIRSAPSRQTQRFVEYWDTRSAEQALKAMKSKKVFDSKISVEYSLPGGFRKTQEFCPAMRLPTIERVSRSNPLPIE